MSSTGTDNRLFNSISRRSAVFLPTPGTSVRAVTSPSATMSTNAAGGWVARIAIASAGPTPWVAIRVWNVARSSPVAKPKSVWASSRMWWWTCRNTVVVGSSSASVRGDTVTT